MSESLQNQYKSLEVSALAQDGIAHEAKKEAEAAQHRSDIAQMRAEALRERMAVIAEQLTQEDV